MLEIPLSQGKVAVIDDADWPIVSQYTWHAHRRPHTWYAETHLTNDDGRKSWRKITMHQLLLGKPPTGMEIDHRDGDGLNNRRGNLRVATKTQNNQNLTMMNRKNTSGFRGVSYHKRLKKWHAKIGDNGRRIHLGYFDTAEDAAAAFMAACQRLHGDFASPKPTKTSRPLRRSA